MPSAGVGARSGEQTMAEVLEQSAAVTPSGGATGGAGEAVAPTSGRSTPQPAPQPNVTSASSLVNTWA